MPVRTLDEWATPRLQNFPLAALKDTTLGIEAAHYLDRLLSTPPSKEPLLSALGGFPFALKTSIEHELEMMSSFGIRPVFVFSGLDCAVKEKPMRQLREASRLNSQAWELYNQHRAIQAVDAFGNSGSVKPDGLFRFLQRILQANKVEFLVAPYSACAQLAYMEQSPRQFVDAVMGSSDLFLFEVDKIITKLDFERSRFSWLSRRTCQDELMKLPAELFVDACLLSGCSLLPTFPPLENPALYPKPFTIRDTTSLLLTMGRSASAACTHYQDEPAVQQLNYLDRYRRARMAVKHHVIITDSGEVQPLDLDHAPSDVHEFIGLQLPEELYFYLSRGVFGPRVPNWLASGELFEYPPLDSGESSEYQRLVRDQLDSHRLQALALLSQPLFRFYYHQTEVIMRFWFNKDLQKPLRHKDLVPSPREIVSNWNVRLESLKGEGPKSSAPPGSLTYAVHALADRDFVPRTVTPRSNSQLLTTKDEIVSNTLWRFLQLRGYADKKHALTTWGNALNVALKSLAPEDHLEEPILLAMELLRLEALTAGDTPSTAGGASRSADVDRSNTLLVSRVACFGKLRHKPIGFTGPLSRALLSFHSFISTVRESCHDLVEMVLANLLLNGDAGRDRDDWADLGLSLPFIDDNDCGLGIAVKSYLDDLVSHGDPTSASAKEMAKAKGPGEWFVHSVDVNADIDTAFRLWDALIQGIKAAGKDIRGRENWLEVDRWLSQRR